VLFSAFWNWPSAPEAHAGQSQLSLSLNNDNIDNNQHRKERSA